MTIDAPGSTSSVIISGHGETCLSVPAIWQRFDVQSPTPSRGLHEMNTHGANDEDVGPVPPPGVPASDQRNDELEPPEKRPVGAPGLETNPRPRVCRPGPLSRRSCMCKRGRRVGATGLQIAGGGFNVAGYFDYAPFSQRGGFPTDVGRVPSPGVCWRPYLPNACSGRTRGGWCSSGIVEHHSPGASR